MTIGLPRALLYYKYVNLWETFFKALDLQVISSGETNKEIMADGIRYSIDECCLPSKIYMGHVYSLIGKCDYILVPRYEDFGHKEEVCVKFNAMYDIVKNTFKDVKLLDYNINAKNNETELKGFLKMGKDIGKNYSPSIRAYLKAKKVQQLKEKQIAEKQDKLLYSEMSEKILIVSHPYNTYDRMLGYPVIELIRKMGGVPVFADAVYHQGNNSIFKEISQCLYWTYNKELLNAISALRGKVDGIILLTAFPCGPDSLVNELVVRRMKEIPLIHIILDELQGEAGLQTRIESFMDIIRQRETMDRNKTEKYSTEKCNIEKCNIEKCNTEKCSTEKCSTENCNSRKKEGKVIHG